LSVTIGSVTLPASRLLPAAFAQEEAKPLTDEELAGFAESIELAAVAAYGAAVGSGMLKNSAVVQAATTFSGHHREHATAFAALAAGKGGTKATGKPNPGVLQAVGDQIREASSEAGVIKVALDMENAASATYLFALGALKDTARAQLAASVLPVEAQHAVVLGQALGLDLSKATDNDVVPAFETVTRAIAPDKFPVAGAKKEAQ